MTWLSDYELNYVRDAIEETLPDVCNILSVTLTADVTGGVVESWGTATADAKCRLDAIRGREQVGAGAIQEYHGYVLTLKHDVTITTGNRVEMGGETYSVVSVDGEKSGIGCVRAKIELLDLS